MSSRFHCISEIEASPKLAKHIYVSLNAHEQRIWLCIYRTPRFERRTSKSGIMRYIHSEEALEIPENGELTK